MHPTFGSIDDQRVVPLRATSNATRYANHITMPGPTLAQRGWIVLDWTEVR